MRRTWFGTASRRIALALLACSSAAAAEESIWSRVQAPAGGPSLSIGGYSSGCLQGARELAVPGESSGYLIMKPERRRVYGHPQLVDFIVQLGAHLQQAQLGTLGVGDLGQARGGPAPNGHASHQSGLDVDLWYEPGIPGAQQHSVVDLEKQETSSFWSDRVPALLELAASDPHVARIFVNALVKRKLCEAPAANPSGSTPQDRAWLRKLRPWWGHNEHFHVRLECPTDSPECQAQPPLPSGDGCEEIEWWLSPESSKDRGKGAETYQKKVGAQPKLPDTCKKVASWSPRKTKLLPTAAALAPTTR